MMVCIPILLRIFQFVLIHTKALAVNKAEVDVFLEPSCFFNDPMDVGNSTSGSSASLKPNLYILEVLSSSTEEVEGPSSPSALAGDVAPPAP